MPIVIKNKGQASPAPEVETTPVQTVSAPTDKTGAMAKKASNAFYAARQRCENPNHPNYPGYGGVGIKFFYHDVTPVSHPAITRVLW